MNLRIEKGSHGDFWADQLPDGISLMRMIDKITISAALLSFVIALMYVLYEVSNSDRFMYELMPYLAAPFFVCGIIYFMRSKYWWILLIFGGVAIALWFLEVPRTMVFLLLFLMVGSIGVVALVDAVQRAVFYHALHRIEYLNIKEKLTFKDKAVAFLFNVPEDLDTRNITMDYDLSRTKLPWREIVNTISMGMMVGLFIWIYISMNPVFMDLSIGASVPLLMFTLILYIPVLVMPWSIFRSLNVRIETNYRNFKIYNGIRATLQRMAVPVIAALIFVLFAINTSDIVTVGMYILLSAAMIVVIVAAVSFIYYWLFEAVTINDIISKWKLFRPVPVFVGLETDGKSSSFDDVPGTPRRDKSDFGDLILPEDNRPL